ncbi:raffinose/stachyose/melibiose transport system permease protein [Fontibacillus solani]|uniref:Raffinose/stachyose/melibiose transport system permease protein n=1 Tax=Fontibacillus solani TaxID=1572857 RepID=A0A7W3SXV1_9BACL|nr:sugar ABC transporter permease [Fontibacillus solani]MBA9088123.1 raffinose/stachyose/melibiose transport system permease protein [Fontibacillus solani]
MKTINRYAHYLFTLPALLLYAVFFLYPMINGFLYSLSDWDGLSKTRQYIGFDNYGRLMQDDRIRNSLGFTFKYAICLIILTVLLAVLIAVLLNRVRKFQSFFRTSYFFPAVLSMITVGLIWNQLFAQALPVFGKAIGSDLLSKNLLSDPNWAFYGIVLVSLWQGLAIPILLFLAALQSVPKDLIEAASLDGANAWQRFRSVVIPFLIPTLNIVVILSAKSGLTAFDYIIAMTGGGPGRKTESVGLLVYNFAFQEFKFSYASALAMVIFVIIGIVSIVQIRSMSRFEVNA